MIRLLLPWFVRSLRLFFSNRLTYIFLQGTENNDIPLLTLPPPAIVKEGPSSYLGRTGPRTSQKSSRPTTQKNGGGLETLKENEELEAQTGEVKGKGKAKE